MARVAILNSRQTKSPVSSDTWVSRTLEAVRWAAANRHEIVSSTGQFIWDLVSWEAIRLGITVHMVVPLHDTSACDTLAVDLLGPEADVARLLKWIPLDADEPLASKAWWVARDKRVLELAELALPVSLRKASKWNALISAGGPGLEIDQRFRTRYNPESHHLRASIHTSRLNPSLILWPDGFLIHWTRASHGPWPGESKADYYRDFVLPVALESGYHRSGFRTLTRIVRESRIRASSWKIGSGAAMVALTECSPMESVPLIRWRKRWSRWSFEPYGVAVHRNWLQERGGKPVRYLTESEWNSHTPIEAPWCHRKGRKADIWPAEREWRVLGDLELDIAPPEAIRIIVKSSEEVAQLQPICPWPVVPLVT
jgi:hypothetical protein